MTKRTILFRAGAVLLLVIIGAIMLVIGRGHTVYFDNKALEYGGQTYEAPFEITVYVDGEDIAGLEDGERGSSPCIGQSFSLTLGVTQAEGGAEEMVEVKLPLPYDLDGVIINLPGYLAGLPEEAYLTEFIPVPEELEEEEEAPSDGGVPSDEEFLGDI